ncbi:hypothetical protein [Rhizobium mesoamericanum]|uniref:hypothetical protein n=1 Tax=Rhizobium mesoamericanum TaxID=1079800 RepID=UPI00040FD7EA|nr:hypothetical protein [Rhizobium mesoamericanum]
MSTSEKHRDLSQLSALLASHASTATTTTTAQPKKLRSPANDNKPARQQLAWPTFERLAYRKDGPRLFALRHWRNLVSPHQIVFADQHEETDDPEMALEIRPSEAGLLRAVGWEVVGRERWYWTRKMVNTYKPTPAPSPKYRTNINGDLETRVGDLMFRNGEMIRWGETKKGSNLRPVERPRREKGGNSAHRSDSVIWSYIDLLGAVSPLTATPYSKPLTNQTVIGDCYSPLPREEPTAKDKHGRYGVREARDLLRSFGVDGGVPFEQLPVPATRCPRGLVAGKQWLGGVKKPNPTASKQAGREPPLVREIETMNYLEYLRSKLGDHAKVLDMAVSDSSATEIGVAMGLAPAYAEKKGPSLIEAALDALIDLDETARGDFGIEREESETKMAA